MKLFFTLLFLFPALAFAQGESAGNGNEGGNGGDVVICRYGHRMERPILLDYFEKRRMPYLGNSNDAFEKVRFVLKKISAHDPIRARLYEEGLANFIAESFFIENTSLPDVRDEGWIPMHSRRRLARKCLKRQIVIQVWSPHFKENYQSWKDLRSKRYFIDKILWDKLDSSNKAGLILHELMVREGINLIGTRDTQNIRMMNRYWSSSTIELDSTDEYEYKMNLLDFPPVNIAL